MQILLNYLSQDHHQTIVRFGLEHFKCLKPFPWQRCNQAEFSNERTDIAIKELHTYVRHLRRGARTLRIVHLRQTIADCLHTIEKEDKKNTRSRSVCLAASELPMTGKKWKLRWFELSETLAESWIGKQHSNRSGGWWLADTWWSSWRCRCRGAYASFSTLSFQGRWCLKRAFKAFIWSAKFPHTCKNHMFTKSPQEVLRGKCFFKGWPYFPLLNGMRFFTHMYFNLHISTHIQQILHCLYSACRSFRILMEVHSIEIIMTTWYLEYEQVTTALNLTLEKTALILRICTSQYLTDFDIGKDLALVHKWSQ